MTQPTERIPASRAYERRRTERRRMAGDAMRMSPSERRADVARRVRDLLAARLRRDAEPGMPLPGEAELVEGLGTSRNAVRDALEQLRQEGRIERTPGAGSFARSRVYRGRCDLLRDALHPAATGSGRPVEPVRHEVRYRARLAEPPPELVRWLDVGTGGVEALERRTLVGEVPVAVRTFYLAAALVPGLDDQDLTADFFGLLQTMGVDVGRSELMIEAIVADEPTAELLDAPPGTPLLSLENRTWAADGRPLFVSFGRLRSDRVVLTLAKGDVA